MRHVANAVVGSVELKGKVLPDYAGIAEWYCRAVVQGVVAACRWERLGCERFLHMLQEAKKPRSSFYFDSDVVADACFFMENLPHSTGRDNDLVLEPVQCWWVAGIFGFRDKETNRRHVTEASFWIPRKNGKTELAKGIVLYCMLFEGEQSPEGVIMAGSEKQAGIPFKAIGDCITGQLKEQTLGKVINDLIRFRRNNGHIKLLAGRAPNLDGLNPHVVLAEELHAQSQEVMGVVRSAQGARNQPLWLSISTAGRQASSPAFNDWRQHQSILEGKSRADRVFVAMYAPDEGDEDRAYDMGVLEKINPLWGVSLNPISMEGEIRDAKKSEANLQNFKRTRLNIWAQAAGNLFAVEKWDACADPKLTLDVLRGYPMYVGVDLASHSDLNAACFLICVDETLYATFRYWLPERSSRFTDDRYADQFGAWKRDGHLQVTTGSHVHHRTIQRDILNMVSGHNVASFAFDQHQADFLGSEMEEFGHEVFWVPKTARFVSYPTDDIITRHGDPDRFQHDGNPVSSWCAGNVVGYYDANGNVLPKKEQKNSKQSIDGLDALINANAARLTADGGNIGSAKPQKPNVFMERGLIGFE